MTLIVITNTRRGQLVGQIGNVEFGFYEFGGGYTDTTNGQIVLTNEGE